MKPQQGQPDVIELVIFISLFFIMASFSGISFTPPYNEIITISKDITAQQLPPHRHWLEQSFLYPIILSMFGDWVGKSSFLVMTTLNLLINLSLIYFVIRSLSEKYIIILVVFLTFGISNTLRYWIGYSDPTIVLLSTFLSLFLSSNFKGYWIYFGVVIGFLSAIAHPQQSLIIFFICSFLFANKQNFTKLAILFSPILLGIFVQDMYFYFFDFNGTNRLDYITENNLIESVGTRITAEPYKLLLGVFGGASLVLAFIYNSINISKDFLLRISVSALVAFLIGTLVQDTTRVITILLWPSVIFFIIRSNDKKLKKNKCLNIILALAIMASILLPSFHYWDKTYYNLKLNDYFYDGLGHILK
jgi:hypothetical protein